MRYANSLLAGLLLIGSLGAVNSALANDGAMAGDGVLSKQELTQGSYCHEMFPAIRPSTLGTDDPALKSANTGDVIDFYGSCSESPTGSDQVQEQKLDQEHRWDKDND